MVGAITRITKVVSEEAARAAIAESVPPGTEEKNLAAYDAGLKLAGLGGSIVKIHEYIAKDIFKGEGIPCTSK